MLNGQHTFRPLKTLPFPLNIRLSGPQGLSGRCGQAITILLLPVSERRTVQSVVTHNTDCTPHTKYLSTEKYLMTCHYEHRSVTACQSHCQLVLQIFITKTVRSDGSICWYSVGIRGCNCSYGYHEGTDDSEVQLHKFSISALNADWL